MQGSDGEIRREGDHLEDLGVDMRKILKVFVNEMTWRGVNNVLTLRTAQNVRDFSHR
jgi:hypothetical protein